jgi:hypothetical protein
MPVRSGVCIRPSLSCVCICLSLSVVWIWLGCLAPSLKCAVNSSSLFSRRWTSSWFCFRFRSSCATVGSSVASARTSCPSSCRASERRKFSLLLSTLCSSWATDGECLGPGAVANTACTGFRSSWATDGSCRGAALTAWCDASASKLVANLAAATSQGCRAGSKAGDVTAVDNDSRTSRKETQVKRMLPPHAQSVGPLFPHVDRRGKRPGDPHSSRRRLVSVAEVFITLVTEA